jgi:hypothetical protein
MSITNSFVVGIFEKLAVEVDRLLRYNRRKPSITSRGIQTTAPPRPPR